MKLKYWKIAPQIIIALLYSLSVSAQITPELLKQSIADSQYTGNAEVKRFYALTNYKTAWIQKENKASRDIFFNTLKLSAGLGLREKDYQFNYTEQFSTGIPRLQNTSDSLEAEIRITEAAIHFYKDVAYGNIKPSLGYNGLNYVPHCYNIPELLVNHLSKNTLQLLPASLSPALPEIKALENKIRSFAAVLADSSFREVMLVSKKVTTTNAPLISKLIQFGIIGAADKNLTDSILKLKVKEVQLQLSLVPDSLLGSATISQLNIPLTVRLQQLNLSLNYYRWLYCITQSQSVIVVNIPAAYLKVYQNNNVLYEMRVIVGKKSTPTPTLISKVEEVILYPYWHVPFSIATKELLPAIKRNAGYIDAGNYQVLNATTGKIVNPYSVNWNNLSRSNFPYIIRQSTGCDNSLGLIKLNFYNPFGVYLHDTPNKKLFSKHKRYFSHGCMRMEKPMEMGRLVLKNNNIAIDTLTQKGCLRNQSPIIVKAGLQMPVIVWYNPVGIDSSGRVLFFEDVYQKFNWTKIK